MPERGSRTASGVRRERRRTNSGSQVRLGKKLVLNQWLLGLFGADGFEDLAKHLRDEELEGLDENNVHRFHHALCAHLPAEQRPALPDSLLLEYDQSIVAVTQRLNERRALRRERPIRWKYFQYLALLFTEIYLDRYFRDAAALRAALNQRIAEYNVDKDEADRLDSFDEAGDPREQLNKLAFWMATGSGKTLLMHAHILQFRRYLAAHGRTHELNRIILLTPYEGLSRQHLEEFEKSGIEAEIFDKDSQGLFAGQAVEILEITKLKEEMGEKTVAVDAFEGNNLVLVDEGHRGASAGGDGTWLKHRNALCERGFSFEYSATFAQAVQGNQALTTTYARSILIDYSYRWFHGDGFGKDYEILNLEDDSNREWMMTYMTGCLLAFYQQQRLYRDEGQALRAFEIERPLWIFVGGSVTRTLANREATDIIEILRFLAAYVRDPAASIRRIRQVMAEGLPTRSGANMFAGQFAYLIATSASAERIYRDTLALLFNAPAGGALHVENLKGVDGEIALRVGENDPFGVINVGDNAKLLKRCDDDGMNVGEREFAGSLFQRIDDPDSKINVLIGAKKFTEGWSSWRVTTMGLMNVGRGEGAQIIQLFGRGVRLKGYRTSLKRSDRVALPPDLPRPRHIRMLETLRIFGIRADYMAQFREFLEQEGLPAKDEREQLVLPIHREIGTRQLKIIRLKDEIDGVRTGSIDAFRRLGPVPTLGVPEAAGELAARYFARNPVVVNWYPKIQAFRSRGIDEVVQTRPNQEYLRPRHVAFLDVDRLFMELERFKVERGWHNLSLTRQAIRELLLDTSWYRLLIPESELQFDSFDKVRLWHEIALALLKKYTERYYAFRRREWEMPHLEYRALADDDPNFPTTVHEGKPVYGYRIVVDKSREELIAGLKRLKGEIEAGRRRSWSHPGIKVISLDRHVYQPLLYVESGALEVTPVPLNKGELRFVQDLEAFYRREPEYFREREIYLLRNQSKGRGVGFFEAGNFHPDFILWVQAAGRQHVVFVDPKGIRNVPQGDLKIDFHRTIKELESRLGDPTVHLHSFVISTTPSHVMQRLWDMDKAEMKRRNVLFQNEDRDTYIKHLLDTVTA